MKMYSFLLVLFISISASCQNSDTEIIDFRKKNHLIDKVKSIKQRTYKIEGQEMYTESQIRTPNLDLLYEENCNVTFSSRGEMAEKIVYDNAGIETLNQKRIFDSSGNLLEFTTQSGNKFTKEITEIGANGKVEMTKIYNSNNELVKHLKIQYNDLQKPISIDYLNYSVLESKTTYEYGKQTKTVSNIDKNGEVYKKGKLDYKYKNEVDNRKNMLSQIQYYDYGFIDRIYCKYKFDKHNNWIGKVEYVFDEPIFRTEREITYY